MKTFIKIMAVAAFLGYASGAFAQASDSKNGSAGVHMMTPIHLDYFQGDQNNGYLDFGTLVQTVRHGGPGQSYATVHPWATSYGPGDLINMTALAEENPRSSRWTATGEPDHAFTITIPNYNLFLENPLVTGINVAASSWNWASLDGTKTGGIGATVTAFPHSGQLDFAIGATLQMNQDGPINMDLAASFPVSVNY